MEFLAQAFFPKNGIEIISIQSRLRYETLKITLKSKNAAQCNILMLPITLKEACLVKRSARDAVSRAR